jgi:hypothetical protein
MLMRMYGDAALSAGDTSSTAMYIRLSRALPLHGVKSQDATPDPTSERFLAVTGLSNRIPVVVIYLNALTGPIMHMETFGRDRKVRKLCGCRTGGYISQTEFQGPLGSIWHVYVYCIE